MPSRAVMRDQHAAELGMDLQNTGKRLIVMGWALAEGGRLDAADVAKVLREAQEQAARAGVPVAA